MTVPIVTIILALTAIVLGIRFGHRLGQNDAASRIKGGWPCNSTTPHDLAEILSDVRGVPTRRCLTEAQVTFNRYKELCDKRMNISNILERSRNHGKTQ